MDEHEGGDGVHVSINAKAYAHTKNGAGSGSPHNALHSLVLYMII